MRIKANQRQFLRLTVHDRGSYHIETSPLKVLKVLKQK